MSKRLQDPGYHRSSEEYGNRQPGAGNRHAIALDRLLQSLLGRLNVGKGRCDKPEEKGSDDRTVCGQPLLPRGLGGHTLLAAGRPEGGRDGDRGGKQGKGRGAENLRRENVDRRDDGGQTGSQL